MNRQTTILTSHKGVDLHAASAIRVMQDRLPGGDMLLALHRCDVHTFWRGENLPAPPEAAELLSTGRYFNPNKHSFGHFECDVEGGPWGFENHRGAKLPGDWPGRTASADRDPAPANLYDILLGGPVDGTAAAVDICAYPLAETGRVLSAVLWRLVVKAAGDASIELAESLTVTRDGSGLLVNPHMQGWLIKEQR